VSLPYIATTTPKAKAYPSNHDERQRPSADETLNLETLKLTASFLTVPGLKALEKTSTVFRNQVVSDDEVWQIKNKEKDPRLGTFRELACVQQNLIYIQR